MTLNSFQEYREDLPESVDEEIDELEGDILDSSWSLDDGVLRKGKATRIGPPT